MHNVLSNTCLMIWELDSFVCRVLEEGCDDVRQGGGGGVVEGAGIQEETISRFLTSKGLGLQRYW